MVRQQTKVAKYIRISKKGDYLKMIIKRIDKEGQPLERVNFGSIVELEGDYYFYPDDAPAFTNQLSNAVLFKISNGKSRQVPWGTLVVIPKEIVLENDLKGM